MVKVASLVRGVETIGAFKLAAHLALGCARQNPPVSQSRGRRPPERLHGTHDGTFQNVAVVIIQSEVG